MRLGVYGGSFNPPHTGHALAAAELIEKLALDRLLIIPAADPPHKTLAPGSPGPLERLELCRAAFGSIPKAELCDVELRRAGKSYTVDTLAQLRERYPEDELILIMGTDMFLSFAQWYQPERIAALAELAVMRREESPALWERVRAAAAQYREQLKARVLEVENRCVQISSTTVRRMLAFGAPECLAPAVEEMILEKGWYQTDGSLRGLPYAALREASLALHDEKRRPHAAGTADTAAELALRWGEDPEIARRAGILHDITKALGPREQLLICERYAVPLSPFQRENPKLLHAKTGAAVARAVFGEPEPIVSAICWHTTGRAAMSTLEKILYIADYMEPTRDFPGVEQLREATRRDLDEAVWLGLDQSLSHLRELGRSVDPDSREAWSYYRNTTERSQ